MKKWLMVVGMVGLLATNAFALGYGGKTVTTAGTAVRLSDTNVYTKNLIVKANPGNTGVIYIGGVSVLAASANGVSLSASEVWVGDSINLKEVYIDSTVNGEGVGYTYE